MCMGSGAPKPAPKMAQAPTPPAVMDMNESKSKRRRGATNSGTLLTGSSGVTDRAPTMQKTLLGS